MIRLTWTKGRMSSMNVKCFVAIVAFLAIAVPLRSDTPKPPLPVAVTVEQMVIKLKQVAELVNQLEDKSFAKRQAANVQLIRMGTSAIEPLKSMLAAKPNLETATRIQGILREIKKNQRPKNKLRETLARRINLAKGIDPNTPLKDVLDYFNEKYGIPFLIDEQAFKAIGVQIAAEQPVELPKTTGISLRDALGKLVGQLKGEVYTGTFFVQDNLVVVTTTYVANHPATLDGLFGGPSVDAEFEGEALSSALRELAQTTGTSVVLDPRVTAEKARKKVTVALDDVPLYTAVRILADLAGLSVVARETDLYVTSKETAKKLEAEKK